MPTSHGPSLMDTDEGTHDSTATMSTRNGATPTSRNDGNTDEEPLPDMDTQDFIAVMQLAAGNKNRCDVSYHRYNYDNPGMLIHSQDAINHSIYVLLP